MRPVVNGSPIWTLSFCKASCGDKELMDQIMADYEGKIYSKTFTFIVDVYFIPLMALIINLNCVFFTRIECKTG